MRGGGSGISWGPGRRVVLAIVALATALAIAPASSPAATPEPYQTGDFGGFRNILPPGENGFATGADILNFQCHAQGSPGCPNPDPYPPHFKDQLDMYGDLVYNTPGLTAAEIADFFKDASFGVPAGQGGAPYSPPLRCPTGPASCDVVIVRDNAFSVPHVYGETRAATEYGAGYVAAEDRLFFMDVLRHVGRGQGSGFAGASLKGNDVDQWAFAPYKEDDPLTPTVNEDEFQLQYDMADDVYGPEGAQLQQDVQNYVAGINGYILEARLNPNKMPGEYSLIGKTLDDWKVTDPIATASLIGGILGKGGGDEVGSALVLEAAQKRFGRRVAKGVWGDFRRAEDPEAPTTVRGTSFPYEVPRGIDRRAVAMPDRDSVVPAGPEGGSGSGPIPPLVFPSATSNALLVSAANSESGRPLAVMGPQVAYWIPEVLMEMDLHCIADCQGQPDIDAEGATFPGVSLYVLLGRGPDYSWSATSAGQDIIDTFAEELCETGGSPPTINSTSYLYRDQCLPMETLTRTNTITPNPGDPGDPEIFTLESKRTVHGIVYKRGTVKGKPVAFVRARTSYFHEADSALAFLQMNDSDRIQNAQDFQQAMFKMNLTFNWFYADDQDIAFFNGGNNPVRARGVDPNFPAWGTGRWDWRGFNPILRDTNGNIISGDNTAEYTPFSEHPQVINQSYITSWNNKQAPGYRAADDNFTYGSVYRSEPLDKNIEAALAKADSSPGKMTLAELIDAMEEAGTVDLRGTEVLSNMLGVVGSPGDPGLADAVDDLTAWAAAGAHRRDLDRNGRYEHERAIQIMDAWWPRALEAVFKTVLGDDLFNAVKGMDSHGLDNAPNNAGEHLGSAYQGGWYSYFDKDLRSLLGQPVQGRFSRLYCGRGNFVNCRTALRDSLESALAVPPATLYDEDPGTTGTQRVAGCPAANRDQWCFDSVAYRAVGGITVPPHHWINRPTFQQVVEVQGHR